MTLAMTDYMHATNETAIYPGVGDGNATAVTYLALGLAGESSEVLEKAVVSDLPGTGAELGDTLWYLSRLHLELGLDLAVPDDSVSGRGDLLTAAGDLVVAAGRVAEHVKKMMRDDGGEVTAARRQALSEALSAAAAAWTAACAAAGQAPAAIGASNLAKLRGRAARGTLHGSGDRR